MIKAKKHVNGLVEVLLLSFMTV